jgi:hypothetical protein
MYTNGDCGSFGLGWIQMSTWQWRIELLQSGQEEWRVKAPGLSLVRDWMVVRPAMVMHSLAC